MALWLSLVLLLSSSFGRAPELFLLLSPRGWALWLGSSTGLLLAAALNSVNSVAGLCGWALWLWALSSSCAPELCQLCGWAVWLGVSRPLLLLPSSAGLCPGLVLLSFFSAAPLNSVNSVAGLCGWALCPGLVVLLSSLSSSCPPHGRAPELCQLCVLLLPSSWPRP